MRFLASDDDGSTDAYECPSYSPPFQISRRNTGEDSLPASHTCFFSIELPPYKTEAAMRKGLLTAIHYGMVGILNT